jgi:hypothetical protein
MVGLDSRLRGTDGLHISEFYFHPSLCPPAAGPRGVLSGCGGEKISPGKPERGGGNVSRYGYGVLAGEDSRDIGETMRVMNNVAGYALRVLEQKPILSLGT